MWWRERSSGFSPTGHVLACYLVDTFDVVIRPMVYNCMFYFLILPNLPFWDAYKVFLGTSWYASGLAYVFSSLMDPAAASITLVCTVMVIGGLFSGVLPALASMRSRATACAPLHGLASSRRGRHRKGQVGDAGHARGEGQAVLP